MAYFNNFLKRNESKINFKYINNGHNSLSVLAQRGQTWYCPLAKVILEKKIEFSIFFQLSLVTLYSKTKTVVNW